MSERVIVALTKTKDLLVAAAALVGALTMLVGGIQQLAPNAGAILDILAYPFDRLFESRYVTADSPMFVYYERGRDGRTTAYGQLKPKDTSTLPMFQAVRPGTKLEATETVNVRLGPSTTNAIAETLARGDCLEVLDSIREVEVKDASSGGWLEVRRTTC